MLTIFVKNKYQNCIDYSPAGSGQGGGRGGGGQGRGGGQGFGPGGQCTCMSCGESFPHQQGVPCNKMKCPKCGGIMSRKQ